MKYNTGILTFWNVPNYGTFAQAYALQKVIETQFPDSNCKQIAYLNKHHFDFYYSLKPRYKILQRGFYFDLHDRLLPWSSYNKKRKLFINAYKTIPHTEDLSAATLRETEFDNVILGSDIVWDYSFKVFNNDPFLFGNGMKAKSVNAYAASFGTVKKGADHPEYVVNGIKKMAHISVRDENSADIIEEITGTRPEVVLDPTWLWDFRADPNIPKSKYENYMIVYGQDFTEEFIQGIVSYARAHDYKIICLDCNNDTYTWCDVILRQYQLSPMEWISLFRDAQVIATTTFHGLTFSLIFNKRFAFCKTDFIIAKASSFLMKLGLYKLFTDDNNDVKAMIDYDWDYDKINAIIDKERSKSLAFLKNALTESDDE
ncbi:MAG: polysaccharide pyruvyl transferase family protein [Clostridia bacterium]|nr:polysaccharide pyruvyl transferase family protein [Clostridia bacterium]